jgi:transglutaminase-like putative cysteine protease
MRIRVGFDIVYDCPVPTPAMLMLQVHPSREPDLETPDTLVFEPATPVPTYIDGFGNRCQRVMLSPGPNRITTSAIVRDSGEPDPVPRDAVQHPVEDLPADTLVYLLGSRYCETDRMTELAWSLFAMTPPGWPRVQAIVEYAHKRILFGYEYARPDKSAWAAHEECVGVCRDYAHLAITLCRAMNIPARYCTGYLGDIGVPYSPAPMDFSGWFEAYLGGRWYTFDARHNKPRIGRILIGRGRDAADVAISNTFGPTVLSRFVVVTDEVKD